MSLNCQKCLKTFASKSSLNYHIKTICNDNPQIYTCEHCNFNTKIKSNLVSHMLVCKNKVINNIDIIKQELEKSKTETNIYKQELEKSKTETNIYKQELEKSKTEVTQYKERVKFLEEQYILIVGKLTENKDLLANNQSHNTITTTTTNSNNTTTTNNTINVSFKDLVLTKLEPITSETFAKCSQDINQSVLIHGVAGVSKIVNNHFADKVICSDETRNTLNYNLDGKYKKDSNGKLLAQCIIEQSLSHKFENYKDKIIEYYNIETNKDNQSEYNVKKLIKLKQFYNDINKKKYTSTKRELGKSIANKARTKIEFESKQLEEIPIDLMEIFKKCNGNICAVYDKTYQIVRNANKQIVRYYEVDTDNIVD